MNRRALLVAVGLAVLAVAGAVYVLVARSRVEADLAARSDAAAREIEAFEQSDTVARLPSPSSTTATPTTDPAPTTAAAPSSSTTEVPEAGRDPAVTAAIGRLAEDGTVAFVHRAPGGDYGRVGVRNDDGTRTLLDERCVRIHVGGSVLSCLRPTDRLLGDSTFRASAVAGDELTSIFATQTGAASRTRVSSDGRFLAYTAFVEGHSYLDTGGFATETVVVDRGDEDDAWNLEDYDRPDDDFHDALDGQFWGVSPIPGGVEFLVTYGSGDRLEIMRGDAVTHTVVTMADDGTCPAVSPDGRMVVFKRTTVMPDGTDGFRLVARDMASGVERLLAEVRSVDDQVEWLDDHTILYALERADTAVTQPTFDIWRLDIDGGEPGLMVPFADSPAVARTG